MRKNAFKSINKNFSKKKYNLKIYNIIKNYSKQLVSEFKIKKFKFNL
jgi:hypothetical protein